MAINNAKHAQQFIGYNTEDRPKGDFYPSPPIAVEALLERVDFDPRLALEPACGKGDISEVLLKNGFTVVSSDLYDWGYGQPNVDFLSLAKIDQPLHIITNPPFNVPKDASMNFALKALELTKPHQTKVAFLQRLQWLEGKKRKKLFIEYPFAKLLVFSGRLPRMHRFDHTGKESSSMMAFGWFMWDWKHSGPPTIEWY